MTLICLPGGPGQTSAYLGDLGGLSFMPLEPRPGGTRCDLLVGDVEALRLSLGLDKIDLLGHSAGASLACLYASTYPTRIGRLVLVTPSVRGVGLDLIGPGEALDARAGEPWYPEARAAMSALQTGEASRELRAQAAPFYYGRWTAAAQAHSAADLANRDEASAEAFYAGFAPDFAAIRAGLREVSAPVLVLAGALDPAPTPATAQTIADLFPKAELVVQPDAGHFPWVDDPTAFASTVSDFLDRNAA
ncbi:alpha/beta fold hydrolase [Actinokineospora sp. HUAS TT18]|uniref:alpha/beta fold hydrolase n=1 Tax=Actinokineospora sp. HUAS TT18 TaxID=3447451 RepID=UPI003F524CCF